MLAKVTTLSLSTTTVHLEFIPPGASALPVELVFVPYSKLAVPVELSQFEAVLEEKGKIDEKN